MSIAAPATFTITGGATLTLTITGGSTIATATMVINGNTYYLNDVFDKAPAVVNDLQAAASLTAEVAEKLLQNLQFIVQMYDIKAVSGENSPSLPFSITIA